MKFEDLLEQLVTLNVPSNPKRKKSAAFRHFEKYDRDNPISVRKSLYAAFGGSTFATT
jgi:hypothetical protein